MGCIFKIICIFLVYVIFSDYREYILLGCMIWGIVWVVKKIKEAIDDSSTPSRKPPVRKSTTRKNIKVKPKKTAAELEQERKVTLLIYDTTAMLMAYMANIDDVIDKKEIQEIEKIFRKLELSRDGREFIVERFRAYKNDPITEEVYTELARRKDIIGKDVCTIILSFIASIAKADGEIREEEILFLKSVADAFGYDLGIQGDTFTEDDWDVDSSAKRKRKTSQTRKKSTTTTRRITDVAVVRAYELLECNVNMSDEEIERAYNKMVEENQPEVLLEKGLPKGMINKVHERLQEIDEAYMIVMASRRG